MAANERTLDTAAFQRFVAESAATNREEISMVKKAVQVVIDEYLTSTQRVYINKYFYNGMTQEEIAKEHGVNKSTVSKTIHRGLSRINRYLRFSCITFFDAPRNKKYLSRKGGKKLNGLQ